ncbi:cellulose biosynthesis protein BcsQ [Shimwellia blattae]|uniref:Putative cellulose synthase operon protein YhjQ n=1 Tax=Shimwellia blattae (strain ATCC 29907 / DSM 4481 / JCM 1650 / NBRC 105725 / CDC 9005-74) TaxID=630626 RepID=I2B533_SHIBC|nr:cellulose biosynthesis protein BcsQ [Shimwellia blattae]AFJ45637.1 putative cellulose synthase operon protein YhjQ [Shimwellia blattae DSM 4481 = NBRC 105725]VDY63120.1 cell division protein [Shimwellia blattae]VEC20342.1 cell division protein [Shimwellia blattae]
MPLICVCSPKGGVGKTTLVANLAYCLARGGNKVLAIDCDVQNALRLHFGVPLTDGRGYVAKATESADWSQSVMSAGGNLFVLPYGDVTPQQQTDFEARMASDSHFISRGLGTLLNYPGLIVLADFPPGPGAALSAVSRMADMHLVTFLADTSSLTLLPRVENGTLFGDTDVSGSDVRYVLNQANNRRRISREVADVMARRLGDRLIASIHYDESVVEANASQQAIFDFSPASAAAFDIELLSKKVTSLLGITVGDGAVHHSPGATGF